MHIYYVDAGARLCGLVSTVLGLESDPERITVGAHLVNWVSSASIDELVRPDGGVATELLTYTSKGVRVAGSHVEARQAGRDGFRSLIFEPPPGLRGTIAPPEVVTVGVAVTAGDIDRFVEGLIVVDERIAGMLATAGSS